MLLNIKLLLNGIDQFWLNFRQQTKLILLGTILISILVNTFASWSLNLVQQETVFNNRKFVQDISTLVTTNVITTLSEKNYKQILPSYERLLKNNFSIKYIIIFEADKNRSYYAPFQNKEANGKLLFKKQDDYLKNTITASFELFSAEKFLGVVVIGLNSSQNLVDNFKLTQLVIILLFFIFWVSLIIAIIFNAIIITKPLKELSYGVKNIAEGNFRQKVNLPFGGELGELIIQFNEMGKKLQEYDEKNIKQLISEKKKLENLISKIADGALLLDTNLRIIFVNSAAIQIMGWEKKKQVIGTSFWELLPKTMQKKMYTTLGQLVKTSSSGFFYGEIPPLLEESQENGKRSVRMILNIVYGPKGASTKPEGVVVTVQDCTKDMELRQSTTRFIGNISHELRTPLFNINSFIETTQDYSYTLTTNQKKYFLETVGNESSRITRLLTNVLDLSHDNAVTKSTSKSVDLKEIINQSCRSYQLVAKDKNIKLKQELSSSIRQINADFDSLIQVFINLIGNSLKFTYPQGEIIVRVYQVNYKNKSISRIEVLDTGLGIPKSFKRAVFSRFVRVEDKVHNIKGTGLGLAIVELILAEYGSRPRVITKEKVGSIFYFDLKE
jgi:two-component system sensor histidine kinase NblS|tara:strand:+ start:3016 stop:4854 length:1839 start_codon:yes stop_codon:yes gene_type:complete